jgi:hypothetical protein
MIARRKLPPDFANHKVIFIHIPKSAGNAVTQSLFGKSSLSLGAHRRATDWQRAAPDVFAECFKFTFTRHPVDRFVSAFAFLKQGGMTRADAQWRRAFLSGCDDIHAFIDRMRDPSFCNEVVNYVHFIPQWKLICNRKREILIDFVGKYENLGSDFDYIREKIGLGGILTKDNVTDPEFKGDQVLEASEIDFVAHLYETDMTLFGYAEQP